MWGTRRGWAVAAAAIALVATACSGGGGGSGAVNDDLVGRGESVLQFEGAAKLRMGGTLAMPDRPTSGPVAGVLIVPSLDRNDRNGAIDVVPGDPLYQDVSRAVTGAGMAAFRYDRRGMGVSKLDAGGQLSFDDMVTDAKDALDLLAQRSGVDGSNLAVVGHDVGGIIALRLAAADSRVKSVVLLSTPGRPLVDVMADNFAAAYGPESADAFRGVIATLLSTGSLPDRATMRPEHQTLLPIGQDALLKAEYSLDPAAEAAAVKAPVLLVTGSQSTTVGAADADRFQAALTGAQVLTADTTATLQHVTAALPQAFDPTDHRAHGGGRPADTAIRDEAAMDRIAAFIGSKAPTPRQ